MNESLKEPTQYLNDRLGEHFMPVRLKDKFAEILRDYAAMKVEQYKDNRYEHP